MAALISASTRPLKGRFTPPGDKSISHRAVMLAALAVGRSRIRNLLEAEDIGATVRAMAALGAAITPDAEAATAGAWHVDGVGVGGLAPPDTVLDMGNSGTGARLLLGLCASHPLTAVISGDASLSARPMDRVCAPLSRTGARFEAARPGRLPITVVGTDAPLALDDTLAVASAQVKSALLLAGLNTPGRTVIREPVQSRDHTERMLAGMGADLDVRVDDAGRTITLTGPAELKPLDLTVPGDFSSAAFALVAALVTTNSAVTIENVGLNPTRTGLLEVLGVMGASLEVAEGPARAGEPAGTIDVRHRRLTAIDMDAALAPRLIDECPILFIAAACAEGTSRFRGLGELRVKESDRLAVMTAGLRANGIVVDEHEDGLDIRGCAGPPPGGGEVESRGDHRVAMAFAVLGLAAQKPVTIDDDSAIATSFPHFVETMRALGGEIRPG